MSIDPKTRDRAHIVETRTEAEWGPRGARMMQVRPAQDLDVIAQGHMCACGHGEALHEMKGDSFMCAAEVEESRGAWGSRACRCFDFDPIYCEYGRCTPQDECVADEHWWSEPATKYVCGDACGGKCAEANLCRTSPLPPAPAEEAAPPSPSLAGDGGWRIGDRVRIWSISKACYLDTECEEVFARYREGCFDVGGYHVWLLSEWADFNGHPIERLPRSPDTPDPDAGNPEAWGEGDVFEVEDAEWTVLCVDRGLSAVYTWEKNDDDHWFGIAWLKGCLARRTRRASSPSEGEGRA